MSLKLCNKFMYRVGQNENLNSLCKKFNTSKENVLRNNNNIPIYAGEWIEIKVNDYISHFVRPAETLQDIANTFSLDIDKIKKDNNLANEKVYIGQLIKIYK